MRMTCDEERKEFIEDGEEYHKQQWEENNDVYSLNWLVRNAVDDCKKKTEEARKEMEDVKKV